MYCLDVSVLEESEYLQEEAACPLKAKMFTLWLLTEKVCRPLLSARLPKLLAKTTSHQKSYAAEAKPALGSPNCHLAPSVT